MDKKNLDRLLLHAKKMHAAGKDDPEFLANLEGLLLDHDRETLERSLFAFVRAAWHVIEPGKTFVSGMHIEAICEHLEAVSRGHLKRLIINVPPRSSKSSVVSVLWPAWVWTFRPEQQWLCVSHSDRLATRDTRRMRMVVQSDWYRKRWPITFERDENLKSYFTNDTQGHRIAAGITSGITGLGADLLVLDDPHDRDEAFSQQKRERAIEEYREKLSTRLNDPATGAIVAIGQRLHESDLFGYLIDIGFERLVIPMRYEENHPHKSTTWFTDPRSDGELMCPERFTDEYVQEQESVLGSYAAAGQLQQRPAPRGGGLFKREWFEVVDASPAKADRVRGWDKASTDGAGCYTAGVLMSQTSDGIYYIEDVVRDQVSPNGRHKLMKQTAVLDDAKYGYVTQLIEHEGGSAGKDAAAFEVQLLAGHDVRTERPTGSKEERAAPFAAQAEAGNVKIVRGAFAEPYLCELETFPMGKFKDQVDASSAAFTRLSLVGSNRITGDLLCSGEDPIEERRRFTDEEMEELPDDWKELLTEMRASAAEKGDWGDD